MTNRFKIILSVLFVLSLLLGAISAYGQTSTTTVTVNGNTTTTTTITNTPISTVNTPNTPNIGDITTTITNQTVTDTLTKVANTNSGNLVSTNFCDNSWTGTQKTTNPSGSTSDLGCNYITGKVGETYLYTDKNLISLGITKPEQNLGFTQSASAYTHHYWSWNSWLNFSHSVINNDTGATITQNRILEGNNSISGGNPGIKNLDNIIIGENSASGYTSRMRFDLSSSGGLATWQGVDISQPNLSITYNKLTSTSLTEQTVSTTIIPCESLGTCYVPPSIEQPKIQITTTSQSIDEQIKTTPYQNSITGEVYGMAPPTITSDISVNKTSTETVKMETQATNTALTGDPSKTEITKTETPIATKSEATTSTVKEEPTTSTKESNATTTTTTQETSTPSKTADTKSEQKSEEKQTTTTQSASNENKKTEGSQKETTNEKTVSDTKTTTNEKGSVNVSVEVKVKAAIEKVEKELKSIEDKTKAIQEIKLDGIKAGAPNLSAYESKTFYDVRQMVGVPNPDFFNQINIAQQQIYKDVSLSAYTNKDPIAVRQALQMEIEEEMNKLILEIEQLKRS